jgi:hypothetical protein
VVSRKGAEDILGFRKLMPASIFLAAAHCGLRRALVLAPLFLILSVPLFAGEQNQVMKVKGGLIEITLPDEPMKASSQDLLHWIQNAADAVTTYYGRFPVSHLTLQVRAGNGSGVRHGVTYPTDGGLIRISVGRETPGSDLNDDWTLTHEMTHLAFPSMPDPQHWIEEGLATYVEPVARAQTGNLPVAEMWREFLRDMPKGEPLDGDEGLDHTPTWGRTYWGGAMFCLLADVRIREQTQNRKGLQDALRAILEHGGTIAENWEIRKALAIGDKATGTNVLRDLYQQMGDKPAAVDLTRLWNKLGLSLNGGHVVFNDQAVDAAIRLAITSPRH